VSGEGFIEAHLRRGEKLLAQVDAHLERGIEHSSPEHLARGVELELRIAGHLARFEEHVLTGAGDAETLRFEMRRDSLRNERALAEVSQTLVRRSRELVRYFVDEGPAHRDALWRVLERVDRHGPHRGVTARSSRS
jgi:hypothetical protein